MRLPSAMRLKESRRVPLWNGPIECRLFRFELVAGSARGKGAPPAAASDAGARPPTRSAAVAAPVPEQRRADQRERRHRSEVEQRPSPGS
jgi:hypothetical protein